MRPPRAASPVPLAAARGTELHPRLAGRDNALNLLRLVLAAGVIVAHSFEFVSGETGPLFGGQTIGGWCVAGFFAASGFLIAGSREQLPLGPYLARRAARILPAFWVVLVVTAAVFAPLVSVLSPDDQVVPGSAVGYVVRNLGLWLFQGDIRDTLAASTVPLDWNSSLWTLSYEFAGYVAIGLLFVLARSRRRRFWLCVAALALLTLANLVVELRGSSNSVATNAVRLGALFLAGAVVQLFPRRVVVSVPGLAVAAALVLLGASLHLSRTITPLPIAYLVLGLGAVLPFRVGSRNDISYGIYIYGAPLAQVLLVVRAPDRWSVVGLMVATLTLAAPLAWLSWRCVERPAMRAERRLEARWSDGARASARGRR